MYVTFRHMNAFEILNPWFPKQTYAVFFFISAVLWLVWFIWPCMIAGGFICPYTISGGGMVVGVGMLLHHFRVCFRCVWNLIYLWHIQYNWTGYTLAHDDVIKWKHFPRYWPFVREIHRSPENSPHKGQWRGALIFSLIYARINAWVNNREAGNFRCHRAHYDATVMICLYMIGWLLHHFRVSFRCI